MAHQVVTIKDAISNIDENKYLLPALQRKFVWKMKQIEDLFDSLMQDYPISTFLFWKVKNPGGVLQTYEFLKSCDRFMDEHVLNPKIDLKGEDEAILVLDGQQRLNSFYIGLKGTYAGHQYGKKLDRRESYPENN